MSSRIRIATRGSPLALWQANHVADRLRQQRPGWHIELVTVQTQGDRIQNKPLAQIGGDGLFTKAIQDALLAEQADLAVHSLKDLPTAPVAGLVLAAVPPRAATGDALVSRKYGRIDDLPPAGRVGTGSQRRRAQLLHRRPDLDLLDLRGNIDTRLRKLEELDLDGLILAQAGLERLNLGHVITERLDTTWMLPAVGQGALGLECRTDDSRTQELLRELDEPATHAAVAAERALLHALGGGCQIPIGALGTVTDQRLRLMAAVLSRRGDKRVFGTEEGTPQESEEIGKRLAAHLEKRGARELLGTT